MCIRDSAMMAVFGVPFPHDDDPDRAVRAAIAMMRALRLFNRERAVLGLSLIHISVAVRRGSRRQTGAGCWGSAWKKPTKTEDHGRTPCAWRTPSCGRRCCGCARSWSRPVSYTHLDVYKRQTHKSSPSVARLVGSGLHSVLPPLHPAHMLSLIHI